MCFCVSRFLCMQCVHVHHMCVCVCISVYVCTSVCLFLCMCVGICVCVFLCIYVFVSESVNTQQHITCNPCQRRSVWSNCVCSASNNDPPLLGLTQCIRLPRRSTKIVPLVCRRKYSLFSAVLIYLKHGLYRYPRSCFCPPKTGWAQGGSGWDFWS